MLGVFMGKKKGQATVEFLLMMAVLVPIIVATISTINEKVFKKMGNLLKSEIISQVRYGYGRAELGSKFDETTAAETNGQAPLMWGPLGSDSKHPIKNIQEGWL
jgi:uncharacterized protein (UPF0333 family)